MKKTVNNFYKLQKSFASYHNLGIGGFDWSDDVIAVHELYAFKDYKGNDVLGCMFYPSLLWPLFRPTKVLNKVAIVLKVL